MYEINNMKLRYTLIGVLCFSINIVLQAQQQALEGKIAGFLKGKKATVGVAVDRQRRNHTAQQRGALSASERIQIPCSPGRIG